MIFTEMGDFCQFSKLACQEKMGQNQRSTPFSRIGSQICYVWAASKVCQQYWNLCTLLTCFDQFSGTPHTALSRSLLSMPIFTGRLSMPIFTGRPGCQTMEMIDGSSVSYLALTPCVLLFCIWVEAEGLLDYQGGAEIISIVMRNLRQVIFGADIDDLEFSGVFGVSRRTRAA